MGRESVHTLARCSGTGPTIVWELYVNMDIQKAKQVEDPMQFWSALSGPPSELVVALLGMPVTSADVERSFSLAGLLDDLNRGNTRPHLRRCAVALFVNGVTVVK